MNNNRCVIIFSKHPIVNYKFSHYDKEDVFQVITTVDNARKKSHVIDYIRAKLVLKYLGFHISQCWGLGTPYVRNLDNYIQSAKAQITKIKTALKNYEDEENKKLIPDFENLKYIKTKEKLNEYKKKLEDYLNEKNEKQ